MKYYLLWAFQILIIFPPFLVFSTVVHSFFAVLGVFTGTKESLAQLVQKSNSRIKEYCNK